MTSTNSDRLERMTWKKTRYYIRTDYLRLCEERSKRTPVSTGTGWLSSSFFAVLLFRLSSYSFSSGHTWISRILWHLNILLTGTDISPQAIIGEGFVILHSTGTTIMGSIGKNLTVMACCGVGGEMGREEKVAHWPGVPLIGDDVVLEPYSGILGPVRIGNQVRVCAGAIVSRDIPDNSIVESPRSRIVQRKSNE